MDEAQSNRQIQQMVNFILNEAKDKAEEIDAKTLQEFNVEKLKYAQAAKDRIREEFAIKLKKQETQVAIGRSTAINRARMQKVETRQSFLNQLKGICQTEIATMTAGDRAKYTNICADLIVQGCLKLVEDSVVVKCRREDEGVVRASLEIAARKYTEILKRETTIQKAVSLSVSSQYLPATCGGGVQLVCGGGAISIDNTLHTRLQLVFDNDLPMLRRMIFPSK